MTTKFQIAECGMRINPHGESPSGVPFRRPRSARRPGFTLVELMVVVALLSLIVLALLAVFNSTQRAFRSALTQTDVLEGSRAAMELLGTDLRALAPSGSASGGPVNFFVFANPTAPLVQTLPGTGVYRTNLLNYFFLLGRVNTKWVGVGYIVDSSSASPLYPLYRFYAETNTANSPRTLYDLFYAQVNGGQFSKMSHLIDGVVHLTARAYDTNGTWITSNYTNAVNLTFTNVAAGYGEAQFFMFSNTLPAAVEVELGVMENRVLARAQAFPHNATAQTAYLADKSGNVHLFRQRVSVPNVDITAYQ